ncbi:MAG TPA: Gfo/Idh/MocA family oxidoreductase [Candidatus Brocadiia bacterium]|nr:Gfo/Idh/MocA family oxidoreductase [Candidatus Brocadiia bacterium]
MAKEVRVGLIGYNFMGKAHSNAYLKVAKFFDLPATPVMTAVCGRTPDKVKAFAQKWGWQSVETDALKTIRRKDIDLVDITTPNNSHYALAMAAINAGKAVACEKPLAMNTAQALDLARAAKKAGVPNMVWFNYRRAPAIGLARRIIDEGRLGRIFHIRAVYLQDWIVDPGFPMVWRLDKKIAGSGAHGDLNAHIIDLARYLVGEFEEVCGVAQTFIKQRPQLADFGAGLSAKAAKAKGTVTVDDTVAFLAKLEGGAIGSFEATRFAPGRKNGNRIEINGEKGSLAWSLESMNELQFFSREDPPHLQGFKTILATEGGQHPYVDAWWPAGHIIGYEHTFINHLADLIRGMYGQKKLLRPDFTDGLRCQEVLDAVSQSCKSRKWVKVVKNKI